MIQIDQQIRLYTDTYLITYTNQSSEDHSKYKRAAQLLLPYGPLLRSGTFQSK